MRPALLLSVLLAGCATAPSVPRAHPLLELPAETLEGAPTVVGGPGPVRLVDVWATWCGPCRDAGPRAASVVRARSGVEEIALSVDDDPARVAAFVAANPVPGEVLHFQGGWGAARRSGLHGIPLFIVLDRQGRVVLTVTGDRRDLERVLADALDSALAEP